METCQHHRISQSMVHAHLGHHKRLTNHMDSELNRIQFHALDMSWYFRIFDSSKSIISNISKTSKWIKDTYTYKHKQTEKLVWSNNKQTNERTNKKYKYRAHQNHCHVVNAKIHRINLVEFSHMHSNFCLLVGENSERKREKKSAPVGMIWYGMIWKRIVSIFIITPPNTIYFKLSTKK